MITICFTYFRSLGLPNLRASLFSVRQQDLSEVDSLVILDNNTDDTPGEIQAVIDSFQFPIPVRLLSFKHGDATKTHPWSTNIVVREASAPLVLFCRADYVLDARAIIMFKEALRYAPDPMNTFVTSNVYHLGVDVHACEQTTWRQDPRVLLQLPGVEADHTCIDAGVWMLARHAFLNVGGLDEMLNAWGHAQTVFQHKLHVAGAYFVRVPYPLYYHPMHSAPRDLAIAHEQLQARGISLKDLWARYHGAPPYS